MELREIRTFVLVCKKKSFSKVADILFTTQPTVSKSISALERELGHTLFIRERSTLVLTEFGEDFLPYAEALIREEENIQFFLHSRGTTPKTFLTLGISEITGSLPTGHLLTTLNNAIRNFHDNHPEIHIAVTMNQDRDLLELIRKSRIDMGICPVAAFGDNAAQANDLARCPLFPYGYCLAYSPMLGAADSQKALLQHATRLSYIQDLCSLDLAMLLLSTAEVQIPLFPVLNWYELLLQVTSGNGTALIPALLAPEAGKCGLITMPLTGSEYLSDMVLYTSENNRNQELLNCFRDFLSSALSVH